MQFKFNIGTKVFFGKGCLQQNKQELKQYGRRAVIVTGKHSAAKSGALDDMISVLKDNNIEYTIFDKIKNNPTFDNISEGGKVAADYKADFIIGIGGGSPLDASKAIAVLAVNDIDPLDLYKNKFERKPLPIIAVPTTAGTGSEVTPYSILTRDDLQTKKSFGNDDTFPSVAFVDATYTESLPYNVTVDTAIDALSHAVEGYISKRSTVISDVLAAEAMQTFAKCLNNLIANEIDYNIREKLIYASMIAGMVIAQTGTTIVHGLGYSLTYFHDVPHGRANGMLMKEYLKYNYPAATQKIDNILKFLGMDSIDQFGDALKKLIEPISITREEVELFSSLAFKQKSTGYNIRTVEQEDLKAILERSLKVQ